MDKPVNFHLPVVNASIFSCGLKVFAGSELVSSFLLHDELPIAIESSKINIFLFIGFAINDKQ
jgi:hypothetical protein